ncbi:MAG: NAD-dependent epimerase/dehydratase family protein [Mycobacteriales bacterium]|nr:NAD-dependent epimerase/dehydratase family protein [Mycobacteriales bacterium]
MTRALVTGAGGFVGRHLVDRLRADGWDVVALTRRDADLSDRLALEHVVRRTSCDVALVLHAARGKATPDERATTAAVNASSAGWLVEALPDSCAAVVRLGSSTEYAAAAVPLTEDAAVQPRGFFGATKAAGSLLLQATAAERGIRSVVLRAFQVYGPGDHAGRLVPTVLRAAASGDVLPLTAPGARRDWVWIGDVVDACVRAATRDVDGVVNVGTGTQTANEELAELAARVTGRPVAVDVGAHPGREWDTGDWVCDPTRARTVLGWEPTVDLAEGLRRTWVADHAGDDAR